MRQTDAVLKSTGDSANVTAKRIENLAGALSKKSGVDDDVIQSGENMLLTFKNIRNEAGAGNNIFDRTARVALDVAAGMAAASGSSVDLKATSIQLGKALNDPIAGLSALTRIGVTFSEAQKEQITGMVEAGNVMGAQKLILQELTSEFGGSAAANKTATAAMGVSLGNLAEVVGGVLAPAFQFLADKLLIAIAFLQNNVGPAVQSVSAFFQELWGRIEPVVSIVAGAFVEAWAALFSAIMKLWPSLKKLWEALQPIVKVIGIVIGVVVLLALKILSVLAPALGFIIDIVIQVVTQLAKFVTKVGEVVMAVIHWFQRLPEAIRTILDRVNGWFGGWPGKILGFLGDLGHLLFDIGKAIIQGLWDGMKSLWKSVTGWVGNIGGWIQGLKGPMSVDKVLLLPQGRAIMQGLYDGLKSGFETVKSLVGTMADQLLETFKNRVDKIKAKMADFASSIKDAFGGFSGLLSNFEPGTITAEGIQSQVAAARQFASLLKKLQKAGAGPALLSEVIGQGITEGTAFANALLAGGLVSTLNAAENEILAIGQQAAGGLSTGAFGERLENAQGDLAGARTVVLNVAGSLYGMSEDQLMKLIEKLLKRSQDRNGSLGLA